METIALMLADQHTLVPAMNSTAKISEDDLIVSNATLIGISFLCPHFCCCSPFPHVANCNCSMSSFHPITVDERARE